MKKRFRSLFKKWIPGIISGGADNDPAGISTYSISGAQFGYQQLWLMIVSTPMLIAVQAMCARIGDVTRQGLMTVIKRQYGIFLAMIAMTILLLTNTVTTGADLAGMAEALGLLTGISYKWWIVPIAVFLWYMIVFNNFRIIEKYLLFLSCIFLSYAVSAILSGPRWVDVFTAIVFPPIHLTPQYFATALGILGTTITPFLFFWQSKEELEEHNTKRQLLLLSRREDKLVAPGFIYSNFISLCIMISTGAVLHSRGITSIASAAEAARALEPFAGSYARILFAIGIIGAGLLAIPVLVSSTAYAVSEAFGWRESLSAQPKKAKPFYGIITLSFILAVCLAYWPIAPMQALYYSQVFAGMLAPMLIILIMLLANNKRVMGSSVNGWFDNIFGFLTIVVMVGSTCILLYQLF